MRRGALSENRFFRNGPAGFAEMLGQRASAHATDRFNDLLFDCLGALAERGFQPTKIRAEQRDTADARWRLACEAAAWINATENERDLPDECAADTLCALAVLSWANAENDGSADAAARVVAAAEMVGVQRVMLDGARRGLFTGAAGHEWARELAREHGRMSGEARQNPNRDRARADWAAYTGNLNRTAWAAKRCGDYNISKSTLLDWIQGVQKVSGEGLHRTE